MIRNTKNIVRSLGIIYKPHEINWKDYEYTIFFSEI